MPGRTLPKIKRPKAHREPKPRFVLFCEGKNTEPEYFEAIERKYRDVLVTTHPAVGAPVTIAKQAAKHSKPKRRKNLFEEKDQVWAVFDRDTHPNFKKAVNICQSNNIGVARSNPCFELWLILHEVEYDRPDYHHAVQKRLEELRPEYDSNKGKSLDCDDLVNRVEAAEQRSAAMLQRREDEDNSYGNPSTPLVH